jgi:hypothetical protein
VEFRHFTVLNYCYALVLADASRSTGDGASSTFCTSAKKNSATRDLVDIGLIEYIKVIELNKVLHMLCKCHNLIYVSEINFPVSFGM